MIARRIFLVVLGLFTASIGALFTWVMVQSFLNAQATRAWTETPAVIKIAEIESRQIGEHVPMDYAPKVEFTYDFAGQSYRSNLLKPRGQMWAKERKKAEVALLEFSAGDQVTCWVNPEEPKTAILKHDTKAAGYSIWFPLLFVIGGLGVAIGAFRKQKTEKAE